MTTELASTESRLIRETRKDQSMRDFALELGVSHNAIAMWENGSAHPDEERVRAWLIDPRPWVKQLGLNLFMARHGETLANISKDLQAAEGKAS